MKISPAANPAMVTAKAGPGPHSHRVSPARAGPKARPAVNDSDTNRTAEIRSSSGTSRAVMACVGAHWNPDATPTTTWSPMMSHGVSASAAYSTKKAAEHRS